MIQQVFATKKNMGQAWTKSGKRIVVTRLNISGNVVVGEMTSDKNGYRALQIGFGEKKLKNMTKPLQTQMNKGGFSFGVRQIREVRVATDAELSLKVGDTVNTSEIVQVGDIVDVQARTQGKGFAGVVKRHGFAGGPRTHGQTDRERAPGSIGQRTTPGRVFKGKRMAGHMGNVNSTVRNLQVVYFDDITGEIWLSGPVPGHFDSIVRLTVRDHKDFEGLEADVKQIKEDNETDDKSEQEVEVSSEDNNGEKENE